MRSSSSSQVRPKPGETATSAATNPTSGYDESMVGVVKSHDRIGPAGVFHAGRPDRLEHFQNSAHVGRATTVKNWLDFPWLCASLRSRLCYRRQADFENALARTALACIGLLWVAAAVPARAESLQYELTPDPRNGRLGVELRWETAGRTGSILSCAPRWGTVASVRALLRDIDISGGRSGGEANRWTIEHRPGATIVCRYQVDAGGKPHDWSRAQHPLVTRTFFHGMANAFLLVPQSGGKAPPEFDVLIRWKLPPEWQAVSSLGNGPTIGRRMSLDDLRRSVFFAGGLRTQTRATAGVREFTVALGPGVTWELDDFAAQAARIIDHQIAFMAERDFPPFLVTVIAVGEKPEHGAEQLAGMGLHQSLALYVAPGAAFGDAQQHLIAHEFFHYWNGGVLKAREPDELVTWFVEGLTDYYALRLLGEDSWKPATLSKWLNKHIREYHANPAIHADNEQIRAEFKTRRDTVGEVAYQRGLLLGLRWHWQARQAGVKLGLDQLLITLVERGRSAGLELTNEVIRKVGTAELGGWFAEEFDRYVMRAETVPIPAEALHPLLAARVETVHAYELGFEREPTLSKKRVRGLKVGSAAAQAGLREGDALVGWRIPGGPDERVRLQVQRGDQVETISYFPRGPAREVLQFYISAALKEKPPPRRSR